ncbi:MAG: DNA-directed RNA polymerase subunit beta' [bacterium]|nr:DNA-directed RNA polymerase subunit beta' [bacterium]
MEPNLKTQDITAIRIKIASPNEILSWSKGEVLKPETINYRTQRSERDGLFCERIFGPEKDYECACGKYRKIRYKGIICDRCGVEVTKSIVRRERMGHIKLAAPVAHIWFLRGVPSRIALVLDAPAQQVEKVVYFSNYIITEVDEKAKEIKIKEIGEEYKRKAAEIKERVRLDSGAKRAHLDSEKRARLDSRAKRAKNEKIKTNENIEKLDQSRDRLLTEIELIKPLKIISELEYQDLSLRFGEIFDAGTGAETLRKIFEKINLEELFKELKEKIKNTQSAARKKLLIRLKLIQGMIKVGIRPEWMFLEIIPILPSDLRPIVQLDGGRYASSDLNDLYRRIINRNNRLKYLLEIKSPEVIIRNEKRMLQEAVDALIDNKMRKSKSTTTATTGGRRVLKSLSDMLQGKQGRFRQNLLGKRVDYSGRSVIVVGPKLKLDQCGLPKKMALELFKPFVIRGIIEKELAYNVKGASRLIDEQTDEVWAILEEVVSGKYVLLNRAPTLHRLGIQAFRPILIEGEAIRVHPMVCKGFNADFDGDQMAVHLPLSKEAQKEAGERMLSSKNLLKPATAIPITVPTQDIILGCYWLTKIKKGEIGEGKIFSNEQEAILAHDLKHVSPRALVKVRINNEIIETSVGRILFNEVLPKQMNFINDVINSKKMEGIISRIIEICGVEESGVEEPQEYLDDIKELGVEAATLSGISWGMDDLVIPVEKKKIVEEAEKEVEKIETHYQKGLLSLEEKRINIIEVWQRVKSEVEKLVPQKLSEFGSVFSIIDSGSKGSWSQPAQMAGMKGLVSNPAGQIIELPVKRSFKEGLDVLEYFISTHGARKGTVDTALRTSMAGYLTRRLVDVAHDFIVYEDDCGDKKGIVISKKEADELNQDFAMKILGRVVLEEIKNSKGDVLVKKGELIDWNSVDKIKKDDSIQEIRVRSPLSCKLLRGVCQKCYGWDMGKAKLVECGEAVGVIAAQSIGEPGTQLTMRTFHTGGVASASDITQGLPRVEEIFENRNPKIEGILSDIEGKISEIDETNGIIKIETKDEKDKKEIIEIKTTSKILAKNGEKIVIGQKLTEGNVDLDKYFKINGEEKTQRYILKEIQKIYVSQGAKIHDKHVEVIVRQMFSRIKISEPGDGLWTQGEVVENPIFEEENARLNKEGKTPAKGKPILLGISRVSLSTNSFLSAASFQQTSRVLIKASLDGRVDPLRGLKENVIIGKLILAGTGFKKNKSKKE